MAGVKFLIQSKQKQKAVAFFLSTPPSYIFLVCVLRSVLCFGCEMGFSRVFFCLFLSKNVLICRGKSFEGKPMASILVLCFLGFLGVLSFYFPQSDYCD